VALVRPDGRAQDRAHGSGEDAYPEDPEEPMKFGLIISKQHPPGVSVVDRFREHIDQVRAARDAGFDLIVMGQHYLSTPYQEVQTLPSLARLSAEAGRMRVGATVLLLPLLNPVDVAEQVATLDVISEGRFIFGAGLGYRDEEYEAFGITGKERVPRFLECLQVIKRLWTEDEVTHHGRYFHLTRARMVLKPVQKPHPPIWFAANNDAAVERSARLADAWVINPHAKLDVLRHQMAIYRKALEQAGKPFPADLPIIKELYVAPDRRSAMQECRPFLEAKYKAYASWGQDKALPEGDHFDVEFEELVQDRFIIGDPDDVVRELRRYAELLGVGCFIFRIQWPGMDQARVLRSIALLAERVMPALRNA
jgi:alkanesulfonate monooxygenase SsuD/methylene tetrahydromethanopterin reductase-like flavin-dependent oxidoreductase (luciferase family)